MASSRIVTKASGVLLLRIVDIPPHQSLGLRKHPKSLANRKRRIRRQAVRNRPAKAKLHKLVSRPLQKSVKRTQLLHHDPDAVSASINSTRPGD
jgi:hypothetical protein